MASPTPRLPRYAQALLALLNFSHHPPVGLAESLTEREWQSLLELCDAMQLTLLLGHVARRHLPRWVRERIHCNYLNNQERFARLKLQTEEICSALFANSIDFAVLKGYTHAPHFTPHSVLRSQGDIDIWCTPDGVLLARSVLRQLGYRPVGKSKTRHLDPMIRETSWQWVGNYYAPDLPIPVDLHYQLWDEAMEEIAGPREADMWARRSLATVPGGYRIAYLDLADTLTFASLHMLMHLLHGDLRLQRAWELGFFLQRYSECDTFWLRWQSLYSVEVRRLPVITFALAHEWFGCELPAVIRKEIAALPANILLWLKHHGTSPLESLFAPNKDELWLNLCLLPSWMSKIRVFCRRIVPVQAAGLRQMMQDRETDSSATVWRTLGLLARRLWHHVRTLPLSCGRGMVWWCRCAAHARSAAD